jgi:hypothetical protein
MSGFLKCLPSAQGAQERLENVRNHLLHHVDKVFRPNDEIDSICAEPVSLKKLYKGDASWKTKHTILGWEVDTIAKTIALPPHRVDRLRDILHSIPQTQRCIGVTKWHKILGGAPLHVHCPPRIPGIVQSFASGSDAEERWPCPLEERSASGTGGLPMDTSQYF